MNGWRTFALGISVWRTILAVAAVVGGHLYNEFGEHLSSNILNLAAVVLQLSFVPPSRFGGHLPLYFTNGGTNDLNTPPNIPITTCESITK